MNLRGYAHRCATVALLLALCLIVLRVEAQVPSICPPFYHGPNCDKPCPGVSTTAECSDAGCYGSGPLDCGAECLFNSETQLCTGMNSCGANVCSTKGKCVWNSTEATTVCVCSNGYYGENCETFCSATACSQHFGLENLVCLNDGSCGCPNNDMGHYQDVESLCSACVDGWFGPSCLQECSCSGHGKCNRITGECICYDDDTNGHWVGSECDICNEKYVGDCVTPNTVFTPTYSAVLTDGDDSESDSDATGSSDVSSANPFWSTWLSSYSSYTGFFYTDSAMRTVTGFGGSLHWGTLDADGFLPSGFKRFDGLLWDAQGGTSTGTFFMIGTHERGETATIFIVSNADSYDDFKPTHSSDSASSSSGPSEASAVASAASHQDNRASSSSSSSDSSASAREGASGSSDTDRTEKVSSNFRVIKEWSISLPAGVSPAHARLHSVWGAVVLYPGAFAFLEHRGVLQLSPTFIPYSICIDDPTGDVYFTGSESDTWTLYTTHAIRDDPVRLYVNQGEPVTTLRRISLRCTFTNDGALYTLLTNGSDAKGASSITIALINNITERRSADSKTRRASVPATRSSTELDCDSHRANTFAETFTPYLQSALLVWDEEHRSLHVLSTTAIEETHDRTIWFSLHRSPQEELNLYQRQVVYDGEFASTERQYLSHVPSHFIVLPHLEFFLMLQPFTHGEGGVALDFYTSYSAKSVTPDHVDVAGGATLTVSGVFFSKYTQCVFAGQPLPTTFLNSSAVSCVLPHVSDDDECVGDSIEVRSRASELPSSTHDEVLVYRHSTPTLTRALSAGGPYGSLAGTAPIIVEGQGFVNLTTLWCLFTDAAGLSERTHGSLDSDGAVRCDRPSIGRPSRGDSGTVAVSLDGVTFSDPTPFSFVGGPYALKVLNADAHVISAEAPVLPSITVAVVDSEGHELHELDTSDHVVTISPTWFNSTRAEVERSIDPLEYLIIASYSNRTKNGETSFSVSMQTPLVGIGLLTFSSNGLLPDTFTYTVSEGAPYRMELGVQPSLVGSTLNSTWGSQPVVFFRDVSGNTVSTVTAAMRSAVVWATFDSRNASVSVASAPVSAEGFYSFDDVFPEGIFGSAQTVVFSSGNFSNITSGEITLQNCYPDEYAMHDTAICRPCMTGAICDGSYTISVKNGYWKPTAVSYVVYPCPLQYNCIAGGCAEGYTGPMCTTCEKGYGRLSRLCVRCYSTAANVVIVVLLVVFLLVFVAFIALAVLQSATSLRPLVQVLKIFLDHFQLLSIVVLPLGEMPRFAEKVMVFVRFIGIADLLRLPPVSCLFPTNIHVYFVVNVAYPCVLSVLLMPLIWYGNRLYQRHCKEAVERRLLLASIAPYDSEEAYDARMAELGLNEEPMFGEATSASVEELEPQKTKLRQAYALLDKNATALASISQLPSSRVREAALRSLLEEQEELTFFVERYEAYVSRDERANSNYAASASPSVSFSSHEMPTHLSGNNDSSINALPVAYPAPSPQQRGGTYTLSVPPDGSVSNNGLHQAGPLPSFAANTVGTGGNSGRGDTAKSSFREGADSSLRYSANDTEEVKALFRFPEVTPTFTSLFGDREPFEPIRGNVDLFSDKLTHKSERTYDTVRVRQRAGLSWVKADFHFLIVFGVLTHFFYAPIIYYGLSMLSCTDIDNGYTLIGNTLSHAGTRSVVRADLNLLCSSPTHHSYRLAALTLCCCLGAGYPLLLFLVFSRVWFPKRNFSSIVRAATGYRQRFYWWQCLVLVRRFVAIIIYVVVPLTTYFSVVIVSWILIAMLVLTFICHPHANKTMHKLECFSLLMLIICVYIQLFPYMFAADPPSRVRAAMGAMLIVSICITFLVFIAVAARLAWADSFSALLGVTSWNPFRYLRHRVTRRLYGDTVAEEDDAEAEATAIAARHMPFSSDMYNSQLIATLRKRLQMRAQVQVEREEAFDLEKQMTVLIRGRHIKGRSEATKGLNMRMGVGNATGEDAATNTALILSYIELNEVDLNESLFDELLSHDSNHSRYLESAAAVVHGTVVEHAVQLRRYIHRLEKALKNQRES